MFTLSQLADYRALTVLSFATQQWHVPFYLILGAYYVRCLHFMLFVGRRDTLYGFSC